MAKFKKAVESLSTKKAAPKRAVSGEGDDNVHFIRRNKCKAAADPVPSSNKKSKASGALLKPSPSSENDQTKVLAHLNAKVFPSTPVSLPGRSPLEVVQSLQGDLLEVMSQLFDLGGRMSEQASNKDEIDALSAKLHEEKDTILAKGKEIKALKLKVNNQDEAGGTSGVGEQRVEGPAAGVKGRNM
ncbi:hypothetical protein N665_0507s0001 [Sinapis alba]|nr:hypothetical protein N665_0507s0001 [Sinapis alba]KAF8089381.1 hypothetical protein N665_0507s0001 [Sinapis alba]